jgi:hypothetical protein
MMLMIDLTPDEEAKLRRKAEQMGQDVSDYARRLLLPADDSDAPAPGESLAEALKGRIGGFHSGGQYQFSKNTGEAFLDILLEKKRNGKI